MRSRALAIVFVSMLAAIDVACDGSAQQTGQLSARIDTLASGAVRVHYAGDVAQGARRIEAVAVATVGAAEGAGAAVFGRVRDIALSADAGTIYVLDQQHRQLRIFDRDGNHLRSFGGTGGGPREMRDPRGVRWSPAGTLWIMDYGNQRYTELAPDGELVATHARRVPASGTDWLGAFGEDGALYDVAWVMDEGTRRNVLIRHRVEENGVMPLDTFPLPRVGDAAYVVQYPGGLLNLPVPFSPRPSWAFAGDDAIWTAAADRYVIAKRSFAGDTLLVVEVAAEPQPVSVAERNAAQHEMQATLDPLGANLRQLDFARIPSTKPAHGRIHADHRGRVWVARMPTRTDAQAEGALVSDDDAPPGTSARSHTRFDIFDADGHYLGQLPLPVMPDGALAFTDGYVAGVQRDEFGVERVVVYAVEL
jgi:hypothetical protein